MARIRTIKPEFPQSESMGRVSRDARLLFIQLWTIADDSGRTRGNSRMLASLLFPYDDDAPGLIDSWLAELERESCVVRYSADGQTYLQVCNWLNHQKIDKPSPSKIPAFDESSRILANPCEHSSLDQGPRIKEGTKERDSSLRSESSGQAAPEPAEPSADDRIVNGIVDEFNAFADRMRGNTPGVKRTEVVTAKLRRKLLAMNTEAKRVIRQQGWKMPMREFWQSYFGECEADPWMAGNMPNPNNPKWKQHLECLLDDTRFRYVMDEVIAAMRSADGGRAAA